MARKHHPDLMTEAKDLLAKFKPDMEHPANTIAALRELAASRGRPGVPEMSDDEEQRIHALANEIEESIRQW